MTGTAWLRITHRRCFSCWNLVCVVCVGKLGQLEQIDDIPVPQIVEKIAEVSKSSSECWSIPNLYFEEIKSVSGMSLCETGQLIQICVD